ncbi:AcrR family transcriptional regulator [Clostridium acetobutylicum]|uniref:Transcriptional regulator, AcrR family n=2 Tax=Clostridium TaxID=1485 RepID=Q97IH3_CLOAB|nr:TetR/AcrR family transcriptional regulator [Clostridium acetobutylicum]PSM07890.1 TetR/AcrR family transcriptional regulator [Clostridium sp. NJ4]AAK79634.1 Transcriptional regulator, AcrR family [Clostridium acetobutylicum ATCC 824]ADZ20718.1 Transcriptional regulator, AcrR family [Clostridium acetobutylicum EA 2018]AEI31937.1 AcrR family transcriptional regulator [Clostridium acetobutylicum DSM 1731]AWV79929.1 TetR/AcrR family transcriptional regulator [Clostridium acetobutylicum]
MNECKSKGKNQAKRILDAALNCISMKGYANVSMRDIADEAGVVLSQLSYYYRNKEGIFKEITKRITEKYLYEIDNILKRGKCEEEKISSLIKYFQETLKNNPNRFKILFDLTSMSIFSKPIKNLLNSFYDKASEIVQNNVMNDLIAKERFKNYSPKVLSKMLLGTLYGVSAQFVMSDKDENVPDNIFEELRMMFR